MVIVAPFGAWRSTIGAAAVSEGATRFDVPLVLDGDDVYWVETRPRESGRSVLVRRAVTGASVDVTPQPFSVRSRVHEYGGGAFVVDRGDVWFVNLADQRVYMQRRGGTPVPRTAAGRHRHADLTVDRSRGRLIAVQEDHTTVAAEPVSSIVAIDVETDGRLETLVSGRDFFASPRLSPDGATLAWLTWSHPNMPWTGCELWIGTVTDDGTIAHARHVAGGPRESIFQPEWSPSGVLHFVSDRTGWWNLYRLSSAGIDPLLPMTAEFGLPQWMFGLSTYAFASPTRIVCAWAERGIWCLGVLDTETHSVTRVPTPFEPGLAVRATADAAVLIGGGPTRPRSVVRVSLADGRAETLATELDLSIEEGSLATPDSFEFPTTGGDTAYGFFYAPRNARFTGPAAERPPLIVISHGGPTASAERVVNPRIQYWTTRGFAVADVNYRGSTGFGRAYRDRLDGQWGSADVEDCVHAARHLVARGLVDADRLIVRGSSAGGFSALCAVTFHDVFAAGTSYYGIADAAVLARDTHKFESRSLETLIGPWPDRADIYRSRSPLHHADRIRCPVLLLHGADDAVVPPNQARLIFEALATRGLPAALLIFDGEGHGFRRADTIAAALESELAFYAAVFGIVLPDAPRSLHVVNLDSWKRPPSPLA